MNNILGNNIKINRKKKGLTQEGFASLVGVSFQAVSKWERGETYPEITLLPLISSILNISIDELLGNVSSSADNEISKYLHLYDNYTIDNQEDVYLAFDKAEKLYPNDFRIQVRYMDLINKARAIITPSEYQNSDYKSFDNESNRLRGLYYYINNNCTDDDIRIWAKRIMCEHLMYSYECRGFNDDNIAEFEDIMKTLPSLYETREYVSLMERDLSRWYLVRENTINELTFILSKALTGYCYFIDDHFSNEYRIEVISSINSLLEAFSKEFDIDKNSVQYVYNLGYLAKLYYLINDFDKSYEYLEKAIDEAIIFDRQDNAKQLLKHYEIDNTMTMCERIKALMQEHYGFSTVYKNDSRYLNLTNKLS